MTAKQATTPQETPQEASTGIDDFDDFDFDPDVLNPLDQINDEIFIGKYTDAVNTQLLRENHIEAILSLDGKGKDYDPSELGVKTVKTYNFLDDYGNDLGLFKRAIDNLSELIAAHKPVLVHCHAGRSRSVAVIAGYLMIHKGMGIDSAVALVESKRTIGISIHQGLMDLLESL